MKNLIIIFCFFTTLIFFTNTNFAGTWSKTNENYIYFDDCGTQAIDTHRWIDYDQDGKYEIYYFDIDGYMVTNDTDDYGVYYDNTGAGKFFKTYTNYIKIPSENQPDKCLQYMKNPYNYNEAKSICNMYIKTFQNNIYYLTSIDDTNYDELNILKKLYSDYGVFRSILYFYNKYYDELYNTYYKKYKELRYDMYDITN